MKPNFITVAATRFDNDRDSSGGVTIAYDVLVGEVAGRAYFEYEWQQRDVTHEALFCTPNVAAAVREWIGEDGPSACLDTNISQPTGDPSVRSQYRSECTEAVHEFS